MKSYDDLEIGAKMMIGFGLVALVAGFIGYLGITNLNKMRKADARLYTNMTVPISQVADLAVAFQQIRVSYRDVILTRDTDKQNKYAQALEIFEQQMQTIGGELEKTIASTDIKDAYKNFVAAHQAFVPFQNDIAGLARAGKQKASVALLRSEAAIRAAQAQEAAMEKLIQLNVAAAKTTSEVNDDLANSSLLMMLVALSVGIVSAIILGIAIARGISNPVKTLARKAQEIARGDLTVEVPSNSRDEIGQLSMAFQKMVEGLRDTLGQVGEASSAVASASSQISSSTEEMAAGAQEQTSQAGEVASAVEEMTKTIVENSKNAGNAAETAKRAKAAAQQGGKVVEQTVAGMGRIADVVNQSAETVRALGKSSNQIGEIIGVIDDIADQTNLLALNAAIEAARAGEQGRGFAVVADEVRKLAERTTKATKEIAGMIKQIQRETIGAVDAMEEGTKQVQEGKELADKAGASLKEIVEVSQEVTDMVSQIAAASEQQSSASEQISRNVEAISSVTNQTAGGTQQIARAAEDLSRLTENLQRLVSRFTLTNGGNAGSRGASLPLVTAHPVKSTVAVRSNGALVQHETRYDHDTNR